VSTKEEYQNALTIIVMAARALTTIEDLPQFATAIDRANAVGPLFDPSAWMKNHKKMDEDKTMFEAALPLWKLGKMLEERAHETEPTDS